MRTVILILVLLFLFGCQSARQADFDRGYWQGASDAIKRHYWAKQERERPGERPTRTYHYLVDEPTTTGDGRNLAAEKRAIPVKE